jgi:cell division protein FtsQ
MKASRDVSQHWQRLCAAALLGVVMGSVLLIGAAIDSPVRVVRVTGDLTAAERSGVETAVNQRLSGGLFEVDLDERVEDVLALGWPRDVRVRRAGPGAIDVMVTKDAIVARWGGGGVLNSAGEVIAVAAEPDPSLPMIRCATASGARAMQIFQMLGQVLGSTGLKVAAIEEDALGEWQVTFSNGLAVALGRDDLLQRAERFYRVFDSVIEDRLDRVAHVDARYRNGVAVSWREAGAPQLGRQLASVAGG